MKKILILLFSLTICFSCVNSVKADSSQKVVDEANVLSEAEEAEINTCINDFISKTNYDIVVYLTDEVGDYFDKYDEDEAITVLADDYYDNNGYGIGLNYDGLIMCVVFGEDSIGYNTYTITTCGASCIATYTDEALDYMYGLITDYFYEDKWADGCKEFVSEALYVYENYDNYYSDIDNYPDEFDYREESNPLLDALAPAGVGASVITLILFLILRGQLKNTGVSRTASNYMSNQNINIFRSGDVYLYTTRRMHKIEKPKSSSSSSSHSSIHISSSGRSHGGGGSHHF